MKSKNQQIMILGNPAIRRDSLFRTFLGTTLLCLSVGMLSAQGLHGTVLEAFSRQPLIGAAVAVWRQDTLVLSGTTDSLGRYSFRTSKAGRVMIHIHAEGFFDHYSAEVILDGYSTKRMEHLMEKRAFDLPGVTVVAVQKNSVSFAHTITPDDMVLVAGHFDDPVRIAHSMPGMILLNDQANHLSARGQSPVLNSWYLEGLEIVNPNHTNNAGTFSDQPTPFGGGINMFSAQTLGSTDVYTGLNPIQIGRTAGAVIDMHLHESASPEFRAKAGFLGFEFGGGTTVGAKGILDVNLRYSFTGLLANLGVDFGGERIGFYDGVISFRQQGLRHSLKIFGWAGRSINEFDRLSPDEEHERYKDFFDIYYDNDILGSGFRLDYTLSPSATLRTGAAYSSVDSDYSREGQFGPAPVAFRLHEETNLFFATTEIALRHSARIQTSLGVDYTHRNFKHPLQSLAPLQDELFIRPYIQGEIDLSPAFHLSWGGELKNVVFPGVSSSYDPGYRAVLNWMLKENNILYGGIRHAGGQNVRAFQTEEPYAARLEITKYELGWNFSWPGNTLQLKTYYQDIGNMTVYTLENGFIHLADYIDQTELVLQEDQPRIGQAKYYGVEGQWRYAHPGGWRVMINQSVFNSERKIDEEGWHTGRFNSRYASHFTLSRELIREKKGKNRIWNFSLRGIWHGGLWEESIDPVASAAAETTWFPDQGSFEFQLPSYKRIDLSVARTIGHSKVRWRYALDIQNVAGLTNTAYHFYDPFLEEITAQNHLGIIPVFSVQASW